MALINVKTIAKAKDRNATVTKGGVVYQSVDTAALAEVANIAKNLASNSSDWAKVDQKDKAVLTAALKSLAAAMEESDGKYLSKVHADTAAELITFLKGFVSQGTALLRGGAEFGNFVKDANGAALYMDNDGLWHCETDFMHVRHKLTAKEVQIEEVTHIGGQQLLTAAQMNCAFVADKGDYYRCFFNKEGSDGRKVTNKWKTGDQAYACTFNLEEQADGTLGNHYFWRLVTGTSNDGADTSEYEVDGETVNGGDYHYIDLSKSVASSGSDEPKPGDNIVQLGYRGTDIGASERQAAILMAGAGNASPYIREFTGINSFSLPEPDIQLKPGDNILTGRVRMTAGSTLNGVSLNDTITQLGSKADSALENAAIAKQSADTASDAAATASQHAQDAEDSARSANDTASQSLEIARNLSTGNGNLLRNSGFTGDYIDESVASNTNVNPNTPMYSNPFDHWTYENASAISSVESVTGVAVVLSDGRLEQNMEKGVEQGKEYVFSFKANGTSLSFYVGAYETTIPLDGTTKRYNVKFTAPSTSQAFAITTSTCTVMELQLIEGSVPNTDWINHPNDNDKTLAHFQNLTYLVNSIVNASTQILGGLVLTQLIKVGNYRNGTLQQSEETGGMSGLYNSGNSPFLWGGGTLEKAFYTIAKYAGNPLYVPTDEEVKEQMAQFVVTHGGRAILNDVILRGYIYALGGVFRGNVYANGGVFNNIDSPNGNFKIDEAGNMVVKNATISGNMYAPLFVINNANYEQCTRASSDPYDSYRYIDLDVTGLNIQIDAEVFRNTLGISLPNDEKYNGAIVRISNNTKNRIPLYNSVAKVNEFIGTLRTSNNVRRSTDIESGTYVTMQCECFSAKTVCMGYSYLEFTKGSQMQKIADVQVGDELRIVGGIVYGDDGYKVCGGTSASPNNEVFWNTLQSQDVSYRVSGFETNYSVKASPACTAIYGNLDYDDTKAAVYVYKLNTQAFYGWKNTNEHAYEGNYENPQYMRFYDAIRGQSIGSNPYIDENGILRFENWTRQATNGTVYQNG